MAKWKWRPTWTFSRRTIMAAFFLPLCLLEALFNASLKICLLLTVVLMVSKVYDINRVSSNTIVSAVETDRIGSDINSTFTSSLSLKHEAMARLLPIPTANRLVSSTDPSLIHYRSRHHNRRQFNRKANGSVRPSIFRDSIMVSSPHQARNPAEGGNRQDLISNDDDEYEEVIYYEEYEDEEAGGNDDVVEYSPTNDTLKNVNETLSAAVGKKNDSSGELSTMASDTEIINTLLNRGYDWRVRPPGTNLSLPGSHGPVVVSVNMLIRSISKIDDVNMEYSVQLTFRESWVDGRLAYGLPRDGKPDFIILTAGQQIWMPDSFFQNEKQAQRHMIDKPNVLIRVHKDGRILYSVRISLVLSCPMHLQYYPMDVQTCLIDLASYAYTMDDIEYQWKEEDPVQLKEGLASSLPSFQLGSVNTTYCTSKTTTGSYSCLRTVLQLRRQFSYYLLQLYIPSTMLVIVSWVSFWLDRTAVPARVTLGVTTLLTMTTQASGINAKLPPVSYSKAIDIWCGACLTFIFSALLEFACVTYMASRMFYKNKRPTSSMLGVTATPQLSSNNVNSSSNGNQRRRATADAVMARFFRATPLTLNRRIIGTISEKAVTQPSQNDVDDSSGLQQQQPPPFSSASTATNASIASPNAVDEVDNGEAEEEDVWVRRMTPPRKQPLDSGLFDDAGLDAEGSTLPPYRRHTTALPIISPAPPPCASADMLTSAVSTFAEANDASFTVALNRRMAARPRWTHRLRNWIVRHVAPVRWLARQLAIEDHAKRADYLSRIMFPIVFLIFNIAYWMRYSRYQVSLPWSS